MSNTEWSSPPLSVVRWQAQLLAHIRFLAGEHTRIHAAGWENFEAREPGEDPRTAWRAGLDMLDAQREQAEQTALSAGVEPAWISDARTLGALSSRGRPDHQALTRTMPVRDSAAEAFFLDMLSLDLWHLERMAALAAARTDRIVTGRWSFGARPGAVAGFTQNMVLYHQRTTALTHAARITAEEAEQLWGAAAEGARRAHAVQLASYDELTLVHEWNYYALPRADLAVPPYVPTDPATDTPITGAQALPPPPQRFVAAATATLDAQFVDAAVHAAHHLSTGAADITAAVDTALPSGVDDRWNRAEPEASAEPGTDSARPLGAGPD